MASQEHRASDLMLDALDRISHTSVASIAI
jgi:hypothetical protein